MRLGGTLCHLSRIYNSKFMMSADASSLRTLQIGLTGSIGMGKSTLTKQFRYLGFGVFDADACVHELYSKGGGAIEPLRAVFPEAIVDDAVDRTKLRPIVTNNNEAMQLLNSIVHPLVKSQRHKFYEEANARGDFLVVYDIPLLLEKKEREEVDFVLVVTADAATQEKRVLERPGMTKEVFEKILKNQMPDEEKRKHADFIVKTDIGEGFSATKSQLATVLEKIIEAHPLHFAAWKSRASHSQSSFPFDVVAFDLDDTLVPTLPPVLAAYEQMWSHMQSTMPRSYPDAQATLRDVITTLSKADASTDYTTIRTTALTMIASKHNEQHYVTETVKVFESVRSDVEPHLYPDALDCLRYFTSKGAKCCLMTNGSANVSACSTLGPMLEFSMNAGDAGAMKPSVVPFMSISLKTGVPPHRVLYVGDSYDKDVIGANKAGMATALLIRDATEGIIYTSITPDLELQSLDPSEIEAKLNLVFSTKKA